MELAPFEDRVFELWESVPDTFRAQIRNVALLVTDEPSGELRAQEGLTEADTLLGLYEGIPLTERGEGYGVGITLPDTITLFRLPILEEAALLVKEGRATDEAAGIRLAVAETLWHEVGHYFGLTDEEIHVREEEGTNTFLGK